MLVVRHVDTCFAGETGCEVGHGRQAVPAGVAVRRGLRPTPYVMGLTGTATFDLHVRNCTTLAEKRKFVSHIYYVRDYAVTAGDGIPTLMRSEFDSPAVGTEPAHQDAVALVEGIDGFRVEFGIDNVSKSGDSGGLHDRHGLAGPGHEDHGDEPRRRHSGRPLRPLHRRWSRARPQTS